MSEKVEVRIPDTVHLLKSDLDRLTAEFAAKLIELIKRPGGGSVEMRPVTKYQSVTEEKAVSVDVE